MILNSYFVMTIIMLATMVFALLFFLSTNAYLVGHFRREKISYHNFLSKIKYYRVQMNPFVQGGFILVTFTLAIVVLYTGFTYNAELKVYALPFLIIFALMVSLYFVYPILSQLDEDMTEYRHNYQKATDALSKKKEAEKSIEKTIAYKSQVADLIEKFEKQISTVEDPNKFKLKDSLSIIDEFAATQTKTINSFEGEVLERFNTALNKYFEHKIAIALELPTASLDFEGGYNKVTKEVYDKYHKIFNDTLFVLIDTRKYKTSEIITGGLQILKDNEYSPSQELVELILVSIDNIVGDPRELIDYLLIKKIVELEDLISYAINKKILWVFKNNLFETQDQLSTISERLIKENAYTQSIAFISNYFTRLKTVLAFMEKTKESNNTLELFNNYKKVMNIDATFYNESKVIENKLISVKTFFKGRRVTDTLKRDLQDVSKVTKMYQNKETIDKLYQSVQDKFDDVRLNSIQSLLLYSGIEKDNGLFDVVKTSKLFNDYYNRLLMKDLVVASLLLYAVFIYSNEDEELFTEVVSSIKDTKEYKNTLVNVDLSIGFANHKELARSIIQNTLLKTEKGRVSNIVVNVEKERLTLNKLATIR